jgi:hypothetical protein
VRPCCSHSQRVARQSVGGSGAAGGWRRGSRAARVTATPAAVKALPIATAPITSTPVFARSPGEWAPVTKATLGEIAGTGPDTPGVGDSDGETVGGPGFSGNVVVVDDPGGGGNTASTDPTPEGRPSGVPPEPPDPPIAPVAPLAAAGGAVLTATMAGATQAAPTMTEPSRILSSNSRRLSVDPSGAELSGAGPSGAEASSRSTLPI